MKKVVYQGSKGALSEGAAEEYFRSKNISIELIGGPTFEAIFRGVQDGLYDCAVVPIENSLSGSIHAVYEQLLSYRLSIVGECISVHSLCLCALPGTKIEDISEVFSHPHVLEQCGLYLSTKFKDVKQTPTWDTAGSCITVKERNSKSLAAIASLDAAKYNNLEILDRNVGDLSIITTRYLVLEKKTVDVGENKSLKCSVAVAMQNKPMTLLKVISCFAFNETNITKIDTRPASSVVKLFDHNNQPSNLWDYLFYFDFTTNDGIQRVRQVLDNLKQFSVSLREFGVYQPYDVSPSQSESPKVDVSVPWTAYL
eukprot:TRINITY_DN1445_c0_g2_i1.p1 TRINITY_DN1445_c0_g2~~TRINITY_DN1445_c0_g2_i1.p1  ORF type:complete len:312 (+),score=74.48 TRINITY_DN1445_c0_g2_i1:335-1270(+)